MNIAKEILDRYATIVIPRLKKNIYRYFNKETATWKWGVKAKWQSEPKEFDYKRLGYSINLCLWKRPIDWCTIEFEGSTEQNWDWINLTANKCDELGIDYCVCDHKGKSPYLWICNVVGLETHEQRKALGKLLIPEGSDVDWSNFGQDTLVPIIEHDHWKHLHTHKIISGIDPLHQQNKLPAKLHNVTLNTPIKHCDVNNKPPTNKDYIKKILSTDLKVQQLLAGNIEGHPTPSEARMSLLFCLVGYNLTDQEIHFIMSKSRGLHYNEKPHLQKLELQKARSFSNKPRKIL